MKNYLGRDVRNIAVLARAQRQDNLDCGAAAGAKMTATQAWWTTARR